MKKIAFIIIILTTSLFVFAQNTGETAIPNLPIDEKSKLVTYKEVVQEKGSPQELYDRAITWVKKYYKNSSEVIKTSNRETGIIELRSSIRIYTVDKEGVKNFKNIVYYNFKIECRADRYRYTITDFNEKAVSAAPIELWFNTEHPHWEPNWYVWLNQINDEIIKIINAFEEGMMPVEEESDEW